MHLEQKANTRTPWAVQRSRDLRDCIWLLPNMIVAMPLSFPCVCHVWI